MSDVKLYRIEEVVTGDRYFVSETLRYHIYEHIDELLEGQTIRGILMGGKPMKLRLDTSMRFILIPDEEEQE